ncbi:MAG: VWA domain-containing protein [Ruminococcaceae bacterium]|nr:VWA domain-containing protein [Oscillospiraceae bacterium]
MKTKFTQRILSIFLCIVLIMSCLPLSIMVFAADDYGYKGGAGTKISDLDTALRYSESLGDNASTEYAGRIWTDKSVYTDDVTFATYGGGSSTIKLNENQNGEDFLIAYSALATSESVSGSTQAPVDVVLIIDISGSMSNNNSNMDNGKSRIYNTVQATNNAIDELMALNPYTRVAVVAFSSNAQVLLPLDRYTKTTDWVEIEQPGPNTWEQQEIPYFTLNRETGSNNNATLYTNAINSSNTLVEKTTSVEGGTNIQMGLYEGMQVLAEEDETTADINGETVQRVPSVILLSDGSPTYSSNTSSWWAPSDNNNDGPGDAPYAGNGMKAILVASYMKDAIDRNYGVADTSFATTVYTIGMGITGLEDTEKNLAYMTLDPGTYWNDTSITNNMKTTIKDYWSRYTSNNNTGTLNINVGDSNGFFNYDKNYALTHPNTGYDVDSTNGYDYVDDYYDADNASAVISVFDEIVANIAISAPQVPTEIKGVDHKTDGYITYTDPLGDYMEVKDIKAIIYAGQTFTAKSTATSGNTTTYTFTGEVHSPVYGDQEIRDIIITVTETNGKQTLVVKIPASVIPLRVNEVMLNADGSVKTHTNNGAMPTRVIYSVGLQSKVTKVADNGTVYIDKTALSTDYLAANTNDDGTINFYSNKYTNMHEINGSTVGDTMVEFEPSHSNGFYYILDDMPIYKDADLTQQVSAVEGLDDSTVYYYKQEYYHGNSVETHAVERTGTQLHKLGIEIAEIDGFLYRKAGSPRLNRILKFEGTKTYNNTKTAEDFYAPEFHLADGSTNAYDGKFIVHLGNNGLLTAAAGGDLQISKSVNAGVGLIAPDKTFEFAINLDGDDVNDGEYTYVITDKNGNEVGTGTVSKNNPKVNLKDGQTATIFSLPPDTEYTVTETAVNGFTTQSEGAIGTIAAGQTSVASFTNTYNVTPVQYNELEGTKILNRPGNEWTEKDVFTFFISPYNNAPLPIGYDADAGVVVDGPDVAGGNTATFDFGTIEFTAPGVYRYTIVEKEPENDEYLPGISYSRALYRVVVTVVDNGDGTLSVTDDIQRLHDDDANQLFTYDNGQIVMNSGEEGQDEIKFINTYSATAVTRVPVALKDYTDNSGQNSLVSGMFEFKLEALGVVDVQNDGNLSDDPVKVNTANQIPMPTDAVNGVVTAKNEGHNVIFPAVTFTQNDLAGANTITFRYRMSECIPEEANAENDYTVNGMKYDPKTYEINVVVSVDTTSHILNVSAIYPNDERVVIFENEYTPKSITADIDGNKTLVGRDMKAGESFGFVLGSNAATGNAIREGTVVVPSSTATVTDGKNGVAKSFAFENIEFKKAGTYVFTVSETAGSASSVEYDDSVITVTVVIDDIAKDGELEVISITYDNGKSAAEFTNTYTSKFSGNPVNLSGTKNLTGKTLLAGEFYFDIKEYFNGNEVGDRFVTHTADDSADNEVYSGSIAFLENVTYDKVGTYEYVITEQIPNDKVEGTTYDNSKFRFTVVVEDDLNGNLIVKSTKLEKANGSNWETANAVVFNNTYEPDPTTATLPLINKVIDGDRSEPLKAGEFEFEMKVVSADSADGIILPSNTVVSNAANGNIIFDDITFTKAGTYVVSVQEIEPDEADKVAGITYSSQTITAVYTVHDDRNGKLTATLTRFVGGENIINIYRAEPAEVTIDITKTFTGRANDSWLTTDKFDFTVKVVDADTLTAIENGDIEFTFDSTSTDTATYTISSKGDKVSATVKVNKPGTYKFVVSEINGGIKGVKYDTSNKDVVIVATDDSANAKIKVKINGDDTNKATVDFTNEYEPQATDSIAITAKKKVTASEGNSYTLKGGEFSFVIEGTQGAPMPADTTVENDASGNVNFGTVKFTERGTYSYTIREVQASLGGFTYDGEVYTITVEVTDDYANGKLVATTKITDKSGRDAEVEFDNKYNPKETSAIIFGAKELQGGHKQLEVDEFEFSIKAVTQNAPMPAKTTVKNTATGTFQFDAITYTKVGTYKYEITEKNLNKDGYTYDDTVYTVTVTVTDEGNGLLQAKVDGVGTAQVPTVKFVNKYAPEPVDVVLGVDGELFKEFEGRELKADEFIFAVLDSENKEIATAKNSKDGTFKFNLNFTKAGNYNYTIIEKNNAVAGVTYDEKVYGVEIIISDKDGHLKEDGVVYTLESQPVAEVVFSNTYEAEDTDIIISAIKNLKGRDLNAREFKFALKDKDGKIIATATNSKDGKIVFDKIVLTEAGTYTYIVFEETGTLEHITYDKTEYVVEVTVTDDGKGKLVAATPVIKKAGKNDVVTEIVFENTYTAPAPTPKPEQEYPSSPKTSDNTNLHLLFALLFVSGGGIFGTTLYGRKRKEEKN